MHPLLMTQIAQQEVADRIRAVERERLARRARGSKPPSIGVGRLSWVGRLASTLTGRRTEPRWTSLGVQTADTGPETQNR